jgi:hypothetical protein
VFFDPADPRRARPAYGPSTVIVRTAAFVLIAATWNLGVIWAWRGH